MLVALSALFLGLLTAVISIYSAYVDRQYARASVWPKLEIFRSSSESTFSYGVSNNGTGPAIIKYAKVSLDSKLIKHWGEISEFSNGVQSHISSITIRSGQAIKPIMYSGELVSEILEINKAIDIELCYCSIYEECWVVDRSNNSEPIKQCSVAEEDAFEQ